MRDDKIDLISKDIEFVKDIVQDTSRRLSNLEESTVQFARDFNEHISTDKQMGQELNRIGRILDKNTESLVEHMRRTEINEIGIDELKKISVSIDQRLQPLEKSHIERKTALIVIAKIGAFIAGAVGFFSFIYEMMKAKL